MVAPCCSSCTKAARAITRVCCCVFEKSHVVKLLGPLVQAGRDFWTLHATGDRVSPATAHFHVSCSRERECWVSRCKRCFTEQESFCSFSLAMHECWRLPRPYRGSGHRRMCLRECRNAFDNTHLASDSSPLTLAQKRCEALK